MHTWKMTKHLKQIFHTADISTDPKPPRNSLRATPPTHPPTHPCMVALIVFLVNGIDFLWKRVDNAREEWDSVITVLTPKIIEHGINSLPMWSHNIIQIH